MVIIDYLSTVAFKAHTYRTRFVNALLKFLGLVTPQLSLYETPKPISLVNITRDNSKKVSLNIKIVPRGSNGGDKNGWSVHFGSVQTMELFDIITFDQLNAVRKEYIKEQEFWKLEQKLADKNKDLDLAKFCKEEWRYWSKKFRALCLLIGREYPNLLGDCLDTPLNDWPHDLINQGIFDDVISSLYYQYCMGDSHNWLQAVEGFGVKHGYVICDKCKVTTAIKDFNITGKCKPP